MSETEVWERFWFEGNRYFTWVSNREDWSRLVGLYRDSSPHWSAEQILDGVHVCTFSDYPKYGFTLECGGDKTLRDFFLEHGMTWEVIP